MAIMVDDKELAQRLILTTANVTLYQPGNPVTRSRIHTIVVSNLTAGPLTYSIYVNQAGSNVSNQNALWRSIALVANATHIYRFENGAGIILQNGGAVVVAVSAINSITMTLYGQEIQET